jgi:Mg2+-importing ATPase
MDRPPPRPAGGATVAATFTAAPDLLSLAKLEPDAALAALASGADGLAEQEAVRRLSVLGPNEVGHVARAGVLRRLLKVLVSPLSLLLFALALVNLLTGGTLPAAVIVVIVVLSSLLSFAQEYRSDQAAAALRAFVHTSATVLRPGSGAARKVEEPVANLVPGDVVLLSAGDSVPADSRLLVTRDLFVSQAAFTGESMPIEKFATAVPIPPTSLSDLPNTAFMGSTVLSGSGSAVIVTTGGRTSFGEIADVAARTRVPTSFDRGIDRFVQLMLRVMLVLMPLVFLINGLDKGNWLEALLFAVSIGVGLTPELLPMVVTVNLARGALDMARRHMIVKRLNAIQNLGAMDVLCTDKTGTLTQDKVILEHHVDIDGIESEQVLEYAYLNSYHQTGLKNLLDLAVLRYVHVHERLQADTEFRKVDELPFDFERRRMSVVVERRSGERLLICKGAVEEVLAACSSVEHGGQREPLQDKHGSALGNVVRGLNEDGMRVIAVAIRELPAGAHTLTTADERELTLVGYIAFLDPPKETAGPALHALEMAGISVKVLTGDNDAVTASVCRQVELPVHLLTLGAELAAMDGAALAARANAGTVFAKVTPQQKADLIRALQAAGHVVGFLGDGVNDSIALKVADVGISVDSAVDIAKESADIILLEKNLKMLHQGVLEGRRVFGNIVKYLRMSASSNFGNMLSVVGASLLLPFLPMAPVQILLNNLLYDVSQTALASDSVDLHFLARPRRWHTEDIWRAMLVLGPASSLFDYATFGVLWFVLGAHANAALFQTGWFVESLLSQTLVVHIIRTDRLPIIQSMPSRALLGTTVVICLIGAWLTVSPLAGALGFVPLPAAYWLILPFLLLSYLALAQVLKGRSTLS